MSAELVEIRPQELKFVFEVKKQSSCTIPLISNSDQYVAFKIKTTSPKKYCVRPNIGVIKPYATCDFTVTMQAQRAAPPDFQCKDKFLIQSTVVPFGSTVEDITSDTFANYFGKYIEDKKLRVVLVSPPTSPILLPVNGALKHDSPYETSPQKEKELNGVENIPPRDTISEEDGFKEFGIRSPSAMNKPSRDTNESRTTANVEPRVNNADDEFKLEKNVTDLKSAKDFEELNLKLNFMKSKINEAELTITKLTEERSMTTKERERLKQELAILRRKSSARQVQVGFPFLFVVMVSLISLALGYYVHS